MAASCELDGSQVLGYTRPWLIVAPVAVHEWVKVAQSCLPFCDAMDYAVLGILQARIVEWVAFPFGGLISWDSSGHAWLDN